MSNVGRGGGGHNRVTAESRKMHLLYKIVNFRCRWKVFFKEKSGIPIKQKLVYYSSRTHG